MNDVEEYYYYENMKNLTLYHGTSSSLNIDEKLLPPESTMIIREDFRQNNKNIVFLTTSKLSAFRYAVKACARFGGKPIVYKVEPDDTLEHRIDNEYTCESARIVEVVNNID